VSSLRHFPRVSAMVTSFLIALRGKRGPWFTCRQTGQGAAPVLPGHRGLVRD